MSETENATEVVAEPVVTETAPVEQGTAPVQTTDETPEATEAAPKTFTQEELDAILEKRLAKERRKLARTQEAAPPPEQFDDQGLLRKPEEIIAEYEARKRREAAEAMYYEREEAALEKYADFVQVAYNRALPVTDEMATAISEDESGPEILYWLGSNPREAARIAQLHPIAQAKEIGKIAVQVAANPPVRKTSSAPEPISPVTPQGNGKIVYDTTDPRSIAAMSTSEWIEADRRRQLEKMRKAKGV